MRPMSLVGMLVAGGVALAACGSPAPPAAPPATESAAAQQGTASAAEQGTESAAAQPSGDEAGEVEAEGTLAPPEAAEDAFTYNPALAPPGAELSVQADADAGRTTVHLEVTGLQPNRGYAAHVHQLPCGATGTAAGPHHQHDVDPAASPEKPSSDPAFANPRNEIWLDLRTDAAGSGEVDAEVPFVFADRQPGSVILHEAESTATEPGKAGTAGARIACLTVPFAEVRPG